MATTIRNIPDELLIEILGKLDKKDLKMARLTCVLWSTSGAKWMFQRVYFAPRKAPMKIFSDIAAIPAFAGNVKELIYDGRLFLPELGNFDSYWTAFRARMVEEFDLYEDHTRNALSNDGMYFADKVYQRSIWSMWKLGAGDNMKRDISGDSKDFETNVANSLIRYARLLDQQESIFKKGKDFKALCKGLRSFRNISTVDTLVEFDHYSDYNIRSGDKHDRFIDPHEWYSFRSQLEFGLTVPPSKWCSRPESQDGGEQDQEKHIKWDVRGVHTLFRAISTHCPSLKKLCIASMDYKAPMTIFQLSDTDTEKVRIMARRLTTLQLYPYVTKSADGPEYAKQYHCLELLLQEAKALRILSSSRWLLDEELGGSDDGNEDIVSSERTDFGMFLGKVWPHLTKLILTYAWVKARDLMSISRVHRGSLRDLRLASMSLLGADRWEHLGKEMGQILMLHYVWVDGLHDEVTRTRNSSWPLMDQGPTFIRDMMQWALPDLLEIEEDCGKITGRLRADSS